MSKKFELRKDREMFFEPSDESGKVGYLVLWLMGAPVGLLVLLWLVLGNNLLGAG